MKGAIDKTKLIEEMYDNAEAGSVNRKLNKLKNICSAMRNQPETVNKRQLDEYKHKRQTRKCARVIEQILNTRQIFHRQKHEVKQHKARESIQNVPTILS